MLRMVEVVGISEEGYSEAVREAVRNLTSSGEKIHFFEVIEQRGSVRGGKLKEFQVIIKAAVEL